MTDVTKKIIDENEAEFEAEVEALSKNPQFQEIIAKSRRSLKVKGGISLSEMRKRFGLTKETSD